MIRLIRNKSKGWFQSWGLHHAAITLGAAFIGLPFDISYATVIFATGVYFGREHKEMQLRGGEFEYMDFLAPLAVMAVTLLIEVL